jgi:hypothetical protein
MRLRPDWTGRTVVCIASGPSLTAEDCELVRASGHPVIVTNTTFRRCPWADVLVGFDVRWWKVYGEEVRATFAGRKICALLMATKYGAESPYSDGRAWFDIYPNSGCCAGAIALAGGAARVVLLGYDAGFIDGRKHWHDDHPAELENATSVADWPRLFNILARRAQRSGVHIVNASRATALECFPRVELGSAL